MGREPQQTAELPPRVIEIAAKPWPAQRWRTNVRLRSSSCLNAPRKLLRTEGRRRLGSLKQGLKPPEQCKRSARALVCAFTLPPLASPRKVLLQASLVRQGARILAAGKRREGCPVCDGKAHGGKQECRSSLSGYGKVTLQQRLVQHGYQVVSVLVAPRLAARKHLVSMLCKDSA